MPWAPDYLTLAEAKAYLRVSDTVDDVEIAGWVTSASRAIDVWCNRQFGKLAAPAVRTYRRTPVYDVTTGFWVLQIDDLQDATGVTVNGVAYASSGCTLLPDNAPADGQPWTALGFTSWPYPSYPGQPVSNAMLAPWGWTAVPAQVPAACKLQLNRWNARRDSPTGTTGDATMGGLRFQAKLDPDVGKTLSGLARRRRVG